MVIFTTEVSVVKLVVEAQSSFIRSSLDSLMIQRTCKDTIFMTLYLEDIVAKQDGTEA